MITFWHVLTILLGIEAMVTTLSAIRFRKFFLGKLTETNSDDLQELPKVALLVPFRGLDAHLVTNAESWFKQSYPNYHVFFVVESTEDPAVFVLEQFRDATVFVSGTAIDCGQKVHNLRYAIERIPEEFEIFVFADSDGRIGKEWLASIVRALLKHPDDAVTGYRWFLPREFSIFSHFRAVWNSAVLTLFSESGKSNFAWGGAMGLFRKTFEATRVFTFWEGSLSDDLGLTRAMLSAHRKIRFVPEAIAVSEDGISASGFFSWVIRQLLITKLYHRALWIGTFAYHMIWLCWIILGAVIMPFQFFVCFVLFQLFQGIKAEIRMDCMSKLLDRKAGSRAMAWILSPVMSFVNAGALLTNIFARTISWRGIRYRIYSPNNLEILSRIGAEKVL